MVGVKCPICNVNQKEPFKTWKYSDTEVSRFKCVCGQIFNFYKGKKKNWTIPKSKTKTPEPAKA